MHSYAPLVGVVAFAVGAFAHGRVVTPAPRAAGQAFTAACGKEIAAQPDYVNIDTLIAAGKGHADFTSSCDLWQCRGREFSDDATANIHSFAPGQTVPFTVQIIQAHTGNCNVSVIDLAANTIIGNELIYFDDYADESQGLESVAPNNTAFSVTIPTNLPAKCATAGNCALQWYWDKPKAGQTFMNCVDFALSAGSATSGTGSAPAAVAAPAKSSAAVVKSGNQVSSCTGKKRRRTLSDQLA